MSLNLGFSNGTDTTTTNTLHGEASEKPVGGYINLTIDGLTSGNESCMTVAFYEPV